MTTIRIWNNQWSPVHCSVPCIAQFPAMGSRMRPPAPLRDILSGCCFFLGPWTVTRSSVCMLRRVVAFCWRRQVLLLVLFPRSRCAVVGVPGLCWLRWVPVVCSRCTVVGVPQS